MPSAFALVLLLVAAPFAVWLFVRVLRWRGSVERPSCAKCRYPVAGLTSFVCPECGSDLLEVGILGPHMRVSRPPSALARAAAWTVVLVVAAFPISILVLLAVPQVRRDETNARLAPTVSSAYSGVKLSVVSESFGDRTRWRELHLEVEQGPRAGARRLLLSDQDAGPVQGERVLEALGAAGVDTTKPETVAQSAELADAAQQMWDKGGITRTSASIFTTTSTGSSRFVGPWRPAIWVLGGVWLVVWGVGIVYCVKAARRSRPAP